MTKRSATVRLPFLRLPQSASADASAALVPPATQSRSLTPERRAAHRRKRFAAAGFNTIAIVVFACAVFPVYWMVKTSFEPNNLVLGSDVSFVPAEFTWRNYARVFAPSARLDFGAAFVNSIQITVLTVIIALVFAFMASLAVTRFRFRSRRAFIIAILIVQMIPGEAMIVSIYRVIDSWQLLNTIAALTILYIAAVLPFTIWVLRGFVHGVPIELEEAAMIDGLSRAGAFWRITFPLLAPGLIATGIFGFIQAWNEFLLALVINSSPNMMTLPVWLRTFQVATGTTNWAAIMAGSTLMSIPVIVFFLFVQGRMTTGLVSGAVKG